MHYNFGRHYQAIEAIADHMPRLTMRDLTLAALVLVAAAGCAGKPKPELEVPTNCVLYERALGVQTRAVGKLDSIGQFARDYKELIDSRDSLLKGNPVYGQIERPTSEPVDPEKFKTVSDAQARNVGTILGGANSQGCIEFKKVPKEAKVNKPGLIQRLLYTITGND